MLIAPTEPPALKAIGTSSSAPEKYGVDVLFASQHFGAVGIQRKEVNDLIASLHDGRLQRELAQMKALGLAVLLIEGRMQWATDGSLMSRSQFTRNQMRGLTWSVSSLGYWIVYTESLTDTIDSISSFQKWCQKEKHGSLGNRPNAAKGTWGTVENRDWGIHFLQGFEGMGVDRAAVLYDRYGVPLLWTVTKRDMMALPKFGKKTVDYLFSAIGQTDVEGIIRDY